MLNVRTIPTGFLFTDSYSRGQLETLSIGDYGKSANIKADFLGFTKELNGVPNGPTLPLSEKWVITLSTQYGCIQNCTFCDVPKLQFKGNATLDDLEKQLFTAISLSPEVKYTDRLNIHFARMGEPIVNKHVLAFFEKLSTVEMKRRIQNKTGLRIETIHPVVTTSLPRKYAHIADVINQFAYLKNYAFRGQAGIQFSINSTSDAQRDSMFSSGSLTLEEFSRIGQTLEAPLGRKYCLNFAYASDFEIDPIRLLSLFDLDKFMIKITPIHNNTACKTNKIETVSGYDSYDSYRDVEAVLKAVGFDVLVFVPSMDEEKGLVTCGNLLLSKEQYQ